MWSHHASFQAGHSPPLKPLLNSHRAVASPVVCGLLHPEHNAAVSTLPFPQHPRDPLSLYGQPWLQFSTSHQATLQSDVFPSSCQHSLPAPTWGVLSRGVHSGLFLQRKEERWTWRKKEGQEGAEWEGRRRAARGEGRGKGGGPSCTFL